MRMDSSKSENLLRIKLPNLADLIQPLAKKNNEIA
jgi:hypothetical protein